MSSMVESSLSGQVDHRALGARLDLFHMQEEAAGMVFWHPRGFVLYRLLEEAVRRQAQQQGYEEVRTPQIMRREIWEASGHWQHFAGGMYRVHDGGGIALEAAVKPVSCPGHAQLVARRLPSYRELPLRLSELGLVHRDEPGGTLHGLLRLRQFTQDDGHVFCGEEEAAAEVLRFCRAIPAFYQALGFAPAEVEVALSLRPAERAGDDGSWDRAEALLEGALRELGVRFTLQPGAGAFYGPKIEWALPDHQGRSWQCGTIQLDMVMPGRFGLRYVAGDGTRRSPVMLHRAVYGSLERFLGLLLERHAGALPPWLAPTQVVVLPLGPAQREAAEALATDVAHSGLRVQLWPDDSLPRRLARAHDLAIPHQLLLGPREQAAHQVALRTKSAQLLLPPPAAITHLLHRCHPPL